MISFNTEISKAEASGEARIKEEGQGLPGSPMRWVLRCSQWPALQRMPAVFSTEETNSQHSHHQRIPTAFSPEGPTGYCICRLQLTESLPTPTSHPNLNCPSQCLWGTLIPGPSRALLPAASPASAAVCLHTVTWGCDSHHHACRRRHYRWKDSPSSYPWIRRINIVKTSILFKSI